MANQLRAAPMSSNRVALVLEPGHGKKTHKGAHPPSGPFYPYPQVPLGWRNVQLE